MGTLVPSPVAYVVLPWNTPCSQYAVKWSQACRLWLEKSEVCTLTWRADTAAISGHRGSSLLPLMH